MVSEIFVTETPVDLTSAAAAPDALNEPGPSRISAADKWVKPNGPPVGVMFGARRITEDADVWQHNAWDHVVLPDDYLEKAKEIYDFQKSHPVPEAVREQYNADPASYWNKFYAINRDAFFKDRNWLRSEFPELIACSEADAGPKTVLEVGCGAGNSIFTLMKYNENPDLTVYATDYSATAVQVVKSNPMYPVPEHGKGKIHASVWDITSTPSSDPSDTMAALSLNHNASTEPATLPTPPASTFALPEGVEPGSVDVLTVIYVLSALHPKEWEQAIHNLYTALKPGGILLMRDYGRNDLAQIRIKKDRLLDPSIPHLYIRGDGTRVYFFEKEELKEMLERSPREAEGRMFEISQLGEDRRMLVNRKERKQMYRIWLQVKAKKL
ncbi:S-adenosylmethionine-dependent methyltransferase [Papiliotrema laurentii]|uniref:tRNA N(3)-methylcytidine methyltransferase n=1 Tax=Papiliotrema laurentii TaxID=5418 RepID=A0AAD9CWD6_PAPLA|nr:S-adenosylmethionine-dependent methyltransferase [Papiliotrema laurentii]